MPVPELRIKYKTTFFLLLFFFVIFLPVHAFTLDITVDSVSCNGDSDGKIVVRVEGGTPPYIFTWSGTYIKIDTTNNPIDSLINLPADTYWVVVEDADKNSEFASITVYEPDVLTIDSQSAVDATCNGAGDGTITISVSGGTPAYYYSLDGGLTYTANGGQFTGLSPGSYYVAVRDYHGCTVPGDTLVIQEPPPVTVSIVGITDVSCHGGSDGALTLSAADGATPYLYSIDGGITFLDNGGTFSGLSAGTYPTAARDANGCTGTGPDAVVGEPPPVTLTVDTVVAVRCHGGSDGEIHMTGGSGVAPYTYSIDGGTTFLDNGGTFTGLTAGSYAVAVQDAHGCETSGGTVTVGEPAALTVEVTVTDVTCHGAGDGRITLTAGGGTPSYLYSLDGGTTFLDNGGVFTGLAPGTYDPAVRDAHGCTTAGATVLVQEPAALTLSAAATDVTCHGGADGTVTLTAGGGTSPYEYSIDGGTTYHDNGGVFTGLTAGSYTPAVRDAHGCILSGAVVTVAEPPLLTVTAAVTDVTCHGAGDGVVTLTAGGGTAPYTYSLDGGTTFTDNGGVFTGLAPGTYDPAVRDAHGCVAAGATVLVQEPAALTLTAAAEDITCHGAGDGVVTLTAGGGTAPYTYSLDGGTTFLDNGGVFTGLVPGTYDPAVRDARGCETAAATVLVREPAVLVVDSVVVQEAFCAGEASGELRIYVSGGTGPYTFSADNGQHYSDNGGLFTDLAAGSYLPAVRDAHGCTATAAAVTVGEPAPVTFTTDTVRPQCTRHSADGEIAVAAGGGTAPYLYSVDGGDSWQVAPLFGGLEGGTYLVMVKDDHGCTAGQLVTLTGRINVQASAGADTAVCPGGSVVLHGAGGDTYAWLPADDLDDPASQDPVARPQVTTDFILTAYRQGCYDQDMVRVTVYPVRGLDAGGDTSVVEGNAVVLQATGEGFVAWHWYPAEGLESTTGRSVTARPTRNMVYYVDGTTTEGCVETDSVHVELVRRLFIPSGFTPNGDGTNDTWHFGHTEYYPNIVVQVFNRWGQRVFYSRGYDSSKEWDGTYNGKALPSGTYYYVVRLNDINGTPPLTGPVTIMR
jgi:gliding motility-associated-like protein